MSTAIYSDLRSRLTMGALVALPFVYLLLLYAFPIYKVVALSLRDYQPAYATDDWIGLENYREILGDARSWQFIGRTFVYTVVCVGTSFCLGLGGALLTVAVGRAFSERWAGALRQVVILPMIFIPAAAGVMWSFAYTQHYGWVNHILLMFGLPAKPWLVTDAAFYLVMATDIWGWTPFLYLIFLAALQQLPAEVIEAARVDGASARQAFWYVILPMLRPVIAIAVTIKSLDTYRAFDYLWIMTKGGPGTSSTTLNIATYKTAFLDLQFGKASAYGVITMLFPFAVVILFLALRRGRVQ
ncbi:MAG: sugar ABC transporter permease [Alphaproteobacteria bacterium]|nr:sugar ABC transporter permease [Alphaproteobacteria bacterium]